MLRLNLSFDDISLYPNKTSHYFSRLDVNINTDLYIEKKGKFLAGVPIVAANMDTVGTIPMAKALAKESCFTALHKYNKNEDVLRVLTDPELSKYVFYTIGMNQESTDQVNWLIQNGVNFNKLQVCFEVANGYMQRFLQLIDDFNYKFPKCIIMAGNIISPELIQTYVGVGVDIIKIGIGNGSACTTSRVAGIGVPQYSLVEMFNEQRKYHDGLLLCSDGGCKEPGHIVKALAGGADLVMVGKMLAGSDEANTVKFIDDNGYGHCEYYGMASKTAMNKHNSLDSHRTPEGRTIEIPYTGPVKNTIDEIIGGLRSACTYLNTDVDGLYNTKKVQIT